MFGPSGATPPATTIGLDGFPLGVGPRINHEGFPFDLDIRSLLLLLKLGNRLVQSLLTDITPRSCQIGIYCDAKNHILVGGGRGQRGDCNRIQEQGEKENPNRGHRGTNAKKINGFGTKTRFWHITKDCANINECFGRLKMSSSSIAPAESIAPRATSCIQVTVLSLRTVSRPLEYRRSATFE